MLVLEVELTSRDWIGTVLLRMDLRRGGWGRGTRPRAVWVMRSSVYSTGVPSKRVRVSSTSPKSGMVEFTTATVESRPGPSTTCNAKLALDYTEETPLPAGQHNQPNSQDTPPHEWYQLASLLPSPPPSQALSPTCATASWTVTGVSAEVVMAESTTLLTAPRVLTELVLVLSRTVSTCGCGNIFGHSAQLLNFRQQSGNVVNGII